MNFRGLQGLKNIAYLYVAQCVQMLLSIVLSVYVPLIIGLSEFSYWQLFIFYSSYVGMLHLGLNDGIYLKYGGLNLNDVDNRGISNQLWVSMCMQLIVLLLIFILLSLKSLPTERIFIFVCVFVYAIVNNIFNFCGSTLQAINRIKVYSFTVVLDKLLVVASILLLGVLDFLHFWYLIIMFILGRTLATVILLIRNKNIFLSSFRFSKNVFKEIFCNIGVGINLMIANIVSSLIVGVGRFFIDLSFPVETFGIVSFAFTLTGFILILISQVGNAVFPILKSKPIDFHAKIFPALNELVSNLSPLCFIFYPLLYWFVDNYLPEYMPSLKYFVILIPLCVFDVKIAMLYNTYMKILRQERTLLYINLFSFVLSVIFSFVCIILFHNLFLWMGCLVLTEVIKSLLLNHYLCKKLNINRGMVTIDLYTTIICTAILFIALSILWTLILIAIVLLAFLAMRYKTIYKSFIFVFTK